MCYRYEYYNFDHGVFDDVVDCTYVMLMEDSPRESHILETISKHTPTSKCIIQYNQGYKKCKKDIKKQLPNHDLVHCLQTVFKHAMKNGYYRILVLEDDCIFDERIHDPEIVNDITTFISENDPKIYSLGTLMHIPLPWEPIFRKHHRLLWATCTHAMIYNLKYMTEVYDKEFVGPCTDVEINRHLDKFTYYKPIAYQTFPDTENSKLGWIIPGLKECSNFIFFKPFGLTHKPQPGFDNVVLIHQLITLLMFIYILKELVLYIIKRTK